MIFQEFPDWENNFATFESKTAATLLNKLIKDWYEVHAENRCHTSKSHKYLPM